MVFEVLAGNSIDAFMSSNSDKLLLSIRDDGTLFRLNDYSWEVLGPLCPGNGPFTIHIMEKDDSENVALVYAVDSYGNLFQSNGELWIELIPSPDTSATYPMSSVFTVSESLKQLVLIDEVGILHFADSDDNWFSPFEEFNALPPRAMSFHYFAKKDSISAFILGVDGILYENNEVGWIPSGIQSEESDIQCFDSYADTETGETFIVAVDQSGMIYTSKSRGELALLSHERCPGFSPWDIKLLHTGGGIFDLLCIDSNGMLSLATDSSWITLSDSFENSQSVPE